MSFTPFAAGWFLRVDTSPEWIFCALGQSVDVPDPAPPLTDYIWDLATQHDAYRIVFEMEPNVILTSHLIGQLVLLHRRTHHSGGVLRINQFSDKNYSVLQLMQLADRFYNFRSREAAVMGYREPE